ncbi:V/A-type H+-transporting ATPase subunit C [Deinococcus sp. HSC-46F16]|uniref:V0D/AC39 family V-type ATPase subunit n=1 Tax=Deinococcus sp. HSC-46F16 TaxID=2910968 RepID=UPI00209EE0C6|nr:V-type ATPase subunit [Deinococcus sp. HSC-46F16]MCP2014147.1 V/A-type H+-transporting ATPase subunit C [Deinococcus sp. HSC-46F16]
MPDDYAYINTRVRVMRTKLLDGRALDSALAAGSYQEFLRVLSETEFAPDLREATAEGAGLPELDRALSQNLFRATQRVLGFADGQARREIEVLLMKWDLANLKTIARGLVGGRGSQAILEGLIPGGTLRPAALQTAAQSSDLASAAAAIAVTGHPLARAFRAAATAYAGSGRLLDLEVALDQGYYRHTLAVARELSLRRYLSREIDVTNALIARTARAQGVPLDPTLFVPGGSLDAGGFARLAGGDASGSADIAAILDAPSLEDAEVAARSLLDRSARSVAVSDVDGVGIILDFLRRKEIEIAKLRLIGRGKFYNLPTEQIRREVTA